MSDAPSRRDLAEWLRYLREIGVDDLTVRSASKPGRRSERASTGAAMPAKPSTVRDDAPRIVAAGQASLLVDETSAALRSAATLDRVREILGDCTRCKLHEGRTHVVFGVGDPDARLMFIGEGPGAEEDRQGEPFVGRAGQKLNEMISKGIGLRREEVYIANIVKCRPPQNRDPQPDEIGCCSPFLYAQIDVIRPEIIVTLGAPATRTLLDTRIGITRLRGTWHEFRGVAVLPTYHPAYLLRAYTPENRRKVYDDMLAVRARLGLDT